MKIPQFLQNTAIYSVVLILQKGISFFLLPLYTLYLQPNDYGILGVASSMGSFVSIFITLSLGAASNRFYYLHNKDENYSRKLFGTVVSIVAINSILIGGLFIGLHKWLVDPFIGNINFYPYILLGLANVIVTPLYLYFQEYLQARQEGVKYGINSMCFFLLQVALTILLLVVFDKGVIGVLWAQLSTQIIFFFYAAFVFTRKLDIGIDKSIAKDCFAYSLPLVPHALANWSNGTIDRLLVNGLKSETDAGLYNLGQQYSSVLNLFANAINQAYCPWFYDKINDKENGIQSIRRVSELSICVLSFTAIAMSLFSREILDIMVSNPAYDEVWKMIPLLVCGYLFHGLYFFFVNILFVNDTKVVFMVTISTIFVNVGLNVLLIPLYGCMGSAIAFFATYVFQSFLAFIISRIRNKTIRLNAFKLFSICSVATIVSVSCILMADLAIGWSIAIKTATLLIAVYSICLGYRELIKKLYRGYVKK